MSNFVRACRKSGAYDFTEKQVDDIARPFIRKYTNARIGGDIKGRGHSMAEAKGQRGKGGAGLRDQLYVVCEGSKKLSGKTKTSVTQRSQRHK